MPAFRGRGRRAFERHANALARFGHHLIAPFPIQLSRNPPAPKSIESGFGRLLHVPIAII